MTIKILITDDHKITRDGLSALIEKQPNMEVIGEADNGRTAVELVDQLINNELTQYLTNK